MTEIETVEVERGMDRGWAGEDAILDLLMEKQRS
jgi:hypothetical protein